MRCRRPRGDRGSLTVLTIGFTALAVLMLLVVVDLSVVFLARRDLVSLADGAAVSAAQRIDLAAFYAGAGAEAVPIDPDQVEDAVAAFAEPGVRLEVVEVLPGGDRVRVVVSREVELPLGGLPGVQRVTVRAEAVARAPLR